MKFFGFVLLLVFESTGLWAQVPDGRANVPPGFVDGSKTPSLVPDNAAFRLVFLSLALPQLPDDKAIARQEAFFNKIGLSGADKSALRLTLVRFSSEHSDWQRTSDAKTLAANEVEAQAWAIVQGTRNAVLKELTIDGNTKLIQYVTLAKTRMIVRP